MTEALLLTILDLGNFLSNFSYDLLTEKKKRTKFLNTSFRIQLVPW